MSDRTESFRQAVEQPRDVQMWGGRHRCVPALIEEIFGDGRQLAYVEAINSRPNHYVVRVDSGWCPDRGGPKPTLGDHTDEILEAARDAFGDAWPDDEPQRVNARPWPAMTSNFDCSYGVLEWPAGYEPAPDAADAMIAVLSRSPVLSSLRHFEWRRLANAAVESLELHVDHSSEAARTAACEAAFRAIAQGWEGRPQDAATLLGETMGHAIEAAVALDPDQRRYRLVGEYDSHVVEDMLIKEFSIFDEPAALGLLEIIALQTIASGARPAHRLVGRTEDGLVHLRIVDAYSKLDTAERPHRFSPKTLETIPSLRIRDRGEIRVVPCTGLIYREDELPDDELLKAVVLEMRGSTDDPKPSANAYGGPAAG